MTHLCDVTNALNLKNWEYTLSKAVYRLRFCFVLFCFKQARKEGKTRETKGLFQPHLLRNVKFIHHFELIVHLNSTFHQLQFRQGQVAEVEFINFIFVCIWQLSLLYETWSQVTGAHAESLGPSLTPPLTSPVPDLSLLEGSEQSGKGHTWQRCSPPVQGHACPALATGQDRHCCPAHQDLSQFFFLAFPRLLPIHLSGFLPGPERAEKNISLLYLRSKYVSTFPFPFFFFLQSSCNRATNSERLPFSVYWQVIQGHGIWSHGVLRVNSNSTNWIPHSSSAKWGY